MKAGFIAVLTLAAAPALAQDGDSAAGRKTAELYCVNCHDIEPDGAPKQHPPSFSQIAAYRPVEQIEYRITYPAYHASMPVLADLIYPGQINDLVAYILSLEED